MAVGIYGTSTYGEATYGPLSGLPPNVTTGAAVITGATTATLAGSIDPQDLQADYLFEYGFTSTYGSETATVNAGTDPINVLQNLTGLEGASKYHYRLVAWNAAGTAYGLDRTFSGLYGPADLSFIHESGMGH